MDKCDPKSGGWHLQQSMEDAEEMECVSEDLSTSVDLRIANLYLNKSLLYL